MIKIEHNTKSLISFLSAVVILVLTASGFGGSGRDAMTAFAETQAPSEKLNNKETIKEETIEKEIQAIEKSQAEQEEQEEPMTEPHEELSDFARKGGLVVGYMMNRKQEAEEEEDGNEQTAAGKGPNYSKEDYQILLKIVEAEAGICDSRGKILVANVVLNRVNSDKFPDTIKEVVYQPSQFSPVSNGSINTCQVTAQTVECVNRALAGEDYSQGALYFMNRGASRSGAVRWFDGRLTFLFSHERHEFFK